MSLFSGIEHLIHMGGDEFLLLMPDNISAKLLVQGAAALHSDPQLFSASTEIQTNISIGLLSIPANVEVTFQDVYRQADNMLYQAKAAKAIGSKQCNLISSVLES